ncbi:hypothetical protein [Sporomusa sp.]|uniref:hypothetical protein n=1 Tax=Sporomusa sp. TaxID=2078658 RepID=UPI002BDB181E|nr:hypothetical protein [Sporomusa sp.]HWR07031.1 hypothetical protein [Sporomusa sp.]
MEKLAEQFILWQNNQIDIWDLEETVHKFHNGPAKELYQRYTMLSPVEVLPYALFKNLIAYEELPDAVADEMKMIASNLYEHNRVEQEYYDETE